jgi:hypothetical protein
VTTGTMGRHLYPNASPAADQKISALGALGPLPVTLCVETASLEVHTYLNMQSLKEHKKEVLHKAPEILRLTMGMFHRTR